MARSTRQGSDLIYEVHRQWLADALPAGGSILTPGNSIWAVEHLQELQGIFLDVPEASKGKTFLERLHDQMAAVSPEAVQLMAELHVVHFLIIWNGAISASKKISDIEAVLSWMPDPVLLPDSVAEAMAPGLAHPGQWVLSRRDTQLTWLIGFALAFKGQSAEDQARLIDDPWALKGFTEAMQDSATEGARLAVLHLAHPDTFEPIVSQTHRHLIVERFAHSAEGADDVDRALLAIRRSLSEQYGDLFHWYEDPLLLRWLKPQEWPGFLKWVGAFRSLPDFDEGERNYKLPIAEQVGRARDLLLTDDEAWYDELKTAVGHKNNNLTLWRTHGTFLTWADAERADAADALRALWAGDTTASERMNSFLDHVPPTVLGPLGERLNIGCFLMMGEDPYNFPPLTISVMRKAWEYAGWGNEEKDAAPGDVYQRWLAFLDEMVWASRDWDEALRDRLDAQSGAWALVKSSAKPASWDHDRWQELLAFRGEAEGEGSVEADETPEVVTVEEDVSGVDHIAVAAADLHVDRSVLDEIVELLENKRQVVLYGPPGTGKTFLGLRLAKAIVQGDKSRISLVQFHPATSYEDFIEGLRPRITEAGHVTYVRTPGPLVRIAEAAAADPDRRYVLVVDEINRANLPKVFGELLFLLEYRRESARTLYRPDEPFSLPDNLWIMGTMNTADRSVALIDAAMRRRFHFVPFFPHDGPMKDLLRRWLEDGGGRLGVADFLEAVNAELLGLVGEHLLIGPSHFMQPDLSDRALERIWTYNVFPLIEEQIWGDTAEIGRWRWEAVRARHGSALTGQKPEDAAEKATEGEAEDPA